MSSSYLMNVSQTNNTILQNRVNQLTIQNNQLMKQLYELESKQLEESTTINNYARRFTKNTTDSSKSVSKNQFLPDGATFNNQLCTVKNIKFVVNETNNEKYILVNLSNPFIYATNENIINTKAIMIVIDSFLISSNDPIDGLNTITDITVSSGNIPFTETTLYATMDSTSNNNLIYDLGTKEGNVMASFANDAMTLSSANWIVQPK